MGLQETIDGLEPRERRLLGLLGAVAVVVGIVGVQMGISSLVDEKVAQNDLLKDAIQRFESEKDVVIERRAKDEAIRKRYEKTAPALAGFLDKQASAADLDIPEIKERSPVERGKKYEERSTSISFRKAGLVSLVKFMEGVASSPHPISITKLNIRRRMATPDTYDVQMVVSSFVKVARNKKRTDGEK